MAAAQIFHKSAAKIAFVTDQQNIHLHPTSVHRNDGSRHEGGLLRAEERHCGRDLFGSAKAPDRKVVVEKIFKSGRILLLKLGEIATLYINHSGCDCGDDDIVLCEFASQGLDVAIECAFGGNICSVTLIGCRGECRNVYDPPPLPLNHMRYKSPIQFVSNSNIKVPHSLPVVDRGEYLLDPRGAAKVVSIERSRIFLLDDGRDVGGGRR